MCGIILVHRKDNLPAQKSVYRRYQKQKNRGSEGFGYIAIKKNKLVSYKRAKLESQIKEFIEKEDSNTIIFHHRYPTSTPNFMESAHPIKVSNTDLKYDYYLIHNGIISNADDLKEKHEKKGFVYNTEIKKKWITSGQTYKEECFNDSESLAIEVALAIENNLNKIESKGSIAFICAKVEKSKNTIKAIYFGRNYGSPLKLSNQKQLLSIGSETEGDDVPTQKLHKLDLKTCEITVTDFEIPSSYSNFNRGWEYDYRDYQSDGYQTTFGYDEDLMNFAPEKLKTKKQLISAEKRWNELDFEIEKVKELLDRHQKNQDGSPESDNKIIETMAVLDSLQEERDKLEEQITMFTVEYD